MSGVVWKVVGCQRETSRGEGGLKTYGYKPQEHRSHITSCHERHLTHSHCTCLCDSGACIIVHTQHHTEPCAREHGTPRGTPWNQAMGV